MSQKKPVAIEVAPAEKITLDDIKHRAEGIRDLAVSETKRVANDVFEADATRTFLIVAGVVVVAASLAYFVGARAGRARMPIDPR